MPIQWQTEQDEKKNSGIQWQSQQETPSSDDSDPFIIQAKAGQNPSSTYGKVVPSPNHATGYTYFPAPQSSVQNELSDLTKKGAKNWNQEEADRYKELSAKGLPATKEQFNTFNKAQDAFSQSEAGKKLVNKPQELGLVGGIKAGVARGAAGVLNSVENYSDYVAASKGNAPNPSNSPVSLRPAAEKILEQNPESPSLEGKTFDPGNWKWYTEKGSAAVPQILAQLGLLYASKGQSAGAQFAAFSAPAVVAAAGDSFKAAKDRGADDATANGEATVNGVVALALQKFNLGALMSSPGVKDVFQKSVISHIQKIGTTALASGGTNALAGIGQSATEDTLRYAAENDPKAFQDWKSRYAASGVQGLGMGLGMGAVHGAVEQVGAQAPEQVQKTVGEALPTDNGEMNKAIGLEAEPKIDPLAEDRRLTELKTQYPQMPLDQIKEMDRQMQSGEWGKGVPDSSAVDTPIKRENFIRRQLGLPEVKIKTGSAQVDTESGQLETLNNSRKSMGLPSLEASDPKLILPSSPLQALDTTNIFHGDQPSDEAGAQKSLDAYTPELTVDGVTSKINQIKAPPIDPTQKGNAANWSPFFQMNWLNRLRTLGQGKPDSVVSQTSDKIQRVIDNQRAALGPEGNKVVQDAKDLASSPSRPSVIANDHQAIPGSTAWVGNTRLSMEPENYPGLSAPARMAAVGTSVKNAVTAIGKPGESLDMAKAVGQMPRLMTGDLFSAIQRGGGQVFESYVDGLQKLNNLSRQEVLDTLKPVQEKMNDGDYESAYRLLGQENSRTFKAVPSGTTVKIGPLSQDIWFYHDKPAEHLQNLMDRTMGRVAWLKEFGDTDVGDLRQKLGNEAIGSVPLFDNIQKQIHGIPIQQPWGPDNLGWRVLSDAVKKIKNLAVGGVLAGPSAISHVALGALGPGNSTMALFGSTQFARSLKYIATEGIDGLRYMGAFRSAVNDWSVDPNSKATTAYKYLQQGLTTGNSYLHAMNETVVSAGVRQLTNDVLENKASRGRVEDLAQFSQLAGFSSSEKKMILDGKMDQKLADALVRKAASTGTIGNQFGVEKSPLESNRLFKNFFQFIGNPIQQLRLMGSTLNNAVNPKVDGAYSPAALRQFARVWTSVPIRGVGLSLMGALLSGGKQGLKIAIGEDQDEAQHETGSFLSGLFLKGLGGPLTLVQSLTQGADPTSVSFSAKYVQDTMQAASAVWDKNSDAAGAYKGLSPLDIAWKYGNNHFPASRIASTWYSIMGLGERNIELEQALQGVSRWKKEIGLSKTSIEGGSDDQLEFRKMMLDAAEDIRENKDPTARIKSFLKLDNSKAPDLGSALRSRKFLAGVNASSEQVERLKNRIGEENYQKVLRYDDVLTAWAEQYQIADAYGKYLGQGNQRQNLQSMDERTLQQRVGNAALERNVKDKKDDFLNQFRGRQAPVFENQTPGGGIQWRGSE